MRNTVRCHNIFGTATLLFFNRIFGRQSVAIPTQRAFNIFPTHSVKTRHHIFDRRYPQMPPVWQTICKRWPVIERKRMSQFCFIQRFMKCVIITPKFHNFMFDCSKVSLGFGFWICHFLYLFVILKTGAYAPGPYAKAQSQLFNNNYFFFVHNPNISICFCLFPVFFIKN